MKNPSNSLDLRNRRASFAALGDGTFDVLVIGAGITGCGVARDAAMRGLRVALVDASDIGAGTSSRSSKLIHGGLRYLAMGDLFVVREAAVERRTLRRIAPHLASTLPVVIPVRSGLDLAKMRTGMWTYEKLGDVAPHERHEVWLWEVAIVLCHLLCAHRDGDAPLLIEVACLLHDLSPSPAYVLLAHNLVEQSPLNPFMGGDVLYLCPLSTLEGDVGVHPHSPLLVSIEHLEVLKDASELVEVSPRLLGG